MIGSKLAQFQITSHLGTGGMGEVYQATDLKLGRSVAIKLLPETFARDADRVARFEREARLLAVLNHPNIAAIHGFERVDDRMFLVMELVDGETLAQRINRGRVPVAEALGIAAQICEALEAAHEKGIIHRDLKPANVKITADGRVKVLDFGLATARSEENSAADVANSPTMLTAASVPGMILGTAAYMSPEQAKGKLVDRRTDIFALGCVLYEMLAGKRAFDGEDVSQILARVLEREPDLSLLPPDTPSSLRKLLQTCFQKNAKDRRGTANDVRIDLQRIVEDLSEKPAEHLHSSQRRLRLPIIALIILLASSIAFGVYAWRKGSSVTQPVVRFTITSPGAGLFVAMSPDGTRIVYSRSDLRQLVVRGLDQFEDRPIPGTEGGDYPFFSPDGQSVGFDSNGLKTVDLISGKVTTLYGGADGRFTAGLRGATWGADGTIVFARWPEGETLWKIPASGGTPQPIGPRFEGKQVTDPSFLPDGHTILFALRSGPTWQINALNPDTNTVIPVLDDAWMPRALAAGYLFFARNEEVMAAPFDLRRFTVGSPRPVDHIATNVGPAFAGYDVSAAGSLVTRAPEQITGSGIAWEMPDRHETVTALPHHPYRSIHLSPDAARAVMDDGGQIVVADLSRGILTPIAKGDNPTWAPDGRRIAYARDRQLYMADADGGPASERPLSKELFDAPAALQWTPDGKGIVFAAGQANTSIDIFFLPLAANAESQDSSKARALIQEPDEQGWPQVSPDGRFIAYQSNGEIFVQPMQESRGRVQVTVGGGYQPRWSRDGHEILFRRELDEIHAAPFTNNGSSLNVGSARRVWTGKTSATVMPIAAFFNAVVYDVAANGRFLILKSDPPSPKAPPELRVVVNGLKEIQN